MFNDILVLTDFPDKDGNLKLRRAVFMHDLKFANNTGLEASAKFSLNVKDGSQLTLEAPTMEEKFSWMAAVIGYFPILSCFS